MQMKKFQVLLIVAAILIASTNAQDSKTIDTVKKTITKALQQLGTLKLPKFDIYGYIFTGGTLTNIEINPGKTKFQFGNGKVDIEILSFGFEANTVIEGKVGGFVPVKLNPGVSLEGSTLKLTVSYAFSGTGLGYKFIVEKAELKVGALKFNFPSGYAGQAATSLVNTVQTPLQNTFSSLGSAILKNVLQNVLNTLSGQSPAPPSLEADEFFVENKIYEIKHRL